MNDPMKGSRSAAVRAPRGRYGGVGRARNNNITSVITASLPFCGDGLACDVSSGRKWGEQWEKVGNWTQGEKRGRGAMGVESTLAVVGTGEPVKYGSSCARR
eukprot:1262567-Pyramimonas_sp.AAC.2